MENIGFHQCVSSGRMLRTSTDADLKPFIAQKSMLMV